VVEIRGAYTRNHSGGSRLQCAGTALNPAYIRGGVGNAVTGDWEISGSYCVIEALKFGPGGFWTVLGPADHIAVRDNDFAGTLDGQGGIWIQNYTVANASNIVLLRNKVHNSGNWQANFDQDSHGTGLYRVSAVVGTSATISNVWILDSEYSYNSGDGIQINGNGPTEIGKIHHVYVGRNVAHHNKQSGFWSKEASDVIFSQNESYLHRPPTDGSASGQGMGFQYGPERVWFLFNIVHDCDYGIQVVSDDSGTGKNAYLIGNVLYRIHGAGSASDPYSPAAIHMRGATNRYLVNNTIYDADAGIESPVDYGFMYMVNNLISAPAKAGGKHVFLESPTLANASTLHHDLLGGGAKINWGGANYSSLAAFIAANPTKGANSLEQTPVFANAAGGDLRIGLGAPGVDAGTSDGVYATFQSLYGISIAKDADGVARPAGLEWDMGAYEPQSLATSFYTLPPCRIVDTRNPTGPWGGPALAANTSRTFAATGACAIPDTATAIAVNAAVTGPTAGGNLRLYPAGRPVPNSSTINFSPGQTRANNAIVGLGFGGQFAVYSGLSSPTGTAHFVLDVTGYFE